MPSMCWYPGRDTTSRMMRPVSSSKQFGTSQTNIEKQVPSDHRHFALRPLIIGREGCEESFSDEPCRTRGQPGNWAKDDHRHSRRKDWLADLSTDQRSDSTSHFDSAGVWEKTLKREDDQVRRLPGNSLSNVRFQFPPSIRKVSSARAATSLKATLSHPGCIIRCDSALRCSGLDRPIGGFLPWTGRSRQPDPFPRGR